VTQNTSGLSTGAKAGIGVGAAAIFIAVLIAVVFWTRRKRQVKGSTTVVDQEQWRRQELDGTGLGAKPEMREGTVPVEADSSNIGVYEHNSQMKSNELEGSGRAELSACNCPS
jgi:hypothetical protein